MQIYTNLLFVLSNAFPRRLKFIYSLDHIVDQKEYSHETQINNGDYSTTQKGQSFFKHLCCYLSFFTPALSIVFPPHSQSSPKTLFDKLNYKIV